MDQFPLGVEFDPTNEDVIHYLHRKLKGKPVFQGTVCDDIDVYSQHPKDLPGQFKLFFTPRHRASGNNVRRSVSFLGKQIGYWHTGDKIRIYRDADEPEEKPVLVGQMTPFSFKVGTSGTDWLMQEFLLPEVRGQFQEVSICKVYKKRGGRINANKGKGKPMLESPVTSGYAGGSEVGNIPTSSRREDVSEVDSSTSKRRKLNEELGFMSEENQVYLSNSLIAPWQHRTSCNQVMLPSPSDELHEKFSLITQPLQRAAGPFYEEIQSLTGESQLYCGSMPSSKLTTASGEADSELKLLDSTSQLYNFAEEAVLQQETLHEGFHQRMLGEGREFGKDNPLALHDTDGDLCYAGNDARNAKNDEVNGHEDSKNDGGKTIQDDLVEVTAGDEEPSAVLSFPLELQQIVHHGAAAENLYPQPLASSNNGSELYTGDQLSAYDLPSLDPSLQFSIGDPVLQFSTDDLPNFDRGAQYYNGISELSNFVAEDYSIWC